MHPELDPVQYEIFRHRLFNILEEGRIAMKMVSGSPVVVEGGESMCSFYTADGTPILTAAGVLLHCMGAQGFVLKTIEYYEDDPGIFDGDQFFFNDPYIGGAHLPDMIIIKPIFYQGKRIAWTGSFMHTAETGGLEPGGMMSTSTEIYHEGIRILGLKVVEKGKFRPDVFRSIVDQVRDPHLVGLDTKAKIAANNVCARNYLDLVKKHGIDFVERACHQIIADSEKMARERLRRLPDGIWRARMYSDAYTREGEKPFKVVCTLTKAGDEVTFDFTGTSPQQEGSTNSTYACSLGSLFVILAGQLFWNVAWNGGMMAPVKWHAPEGTVLNCRFPAACSNGVTGAGMMLQATAHECVAKLLYAGGLYEDVNAGWCGCVGGGTQFGGISQHGARISGMILDSFAVGCGAAPYRDGVNTGGHLINPQSSVSDAEIIEINLPFMYIGFRQVTDSGGFGKFSGGMAAEVMHMVYGTNDLKKGYRATGIRSPGGWGMFGGYPTALQGGRIVRNSNLPQLLEQSTYPGTLQEYGCLQGEIVDPRTSFRDLPVKQYDVIIKRHAAGSGYGDPLDRDALEVLEDVRDSVVSLETAEKVYGVKIDPKSWMLDVHGTKQKREEIRRERLSQGKRL